MKMNKINEMYSPYSVYKENVELSLLNRIYLQCNTKKIGIVDKVFFDRWRYCFFNSVIWMLRDLIF
jgi:hypothetical protein